MYMHVIMSTCTCVFFQRDWETKAAESVDANLENFLGIRDLELGEIVVSSS